MRIAHPSTFIFLGWIPLTIAFLGCAPESELVNTDVDPRRLAAESRNPTRPRPIPTDLDEEWAPESPNDVEPDTLASRTTSELGPLGTAPNPFSPATKLSFALPEGGDSVTLVIHGVDGRLACRLLATRLPGGEHTITWRGCDDSGRRLAAGVYVASLRRGADVRVRKLVMVQ